MKSSFKLTLFISALLITSLACSLGAENYGDPNILYKDDFSDSDSGWGLFSDFETNIEYLNGGLQFNIDNPEIILISTSGESHTDSTIVVEATKSGGVADDYFGIICRVNDALDSYYEFIISSDGYFAIGKTVGDEYEFLGIDGWDTSDVINQGDATNTLTAECVGDYLALSVNGTLLLEANDSELTSGEIGVTVGTISADQTEVLFDEFTIWKP